MPARLRVEAVDSQTPEQSDQRELGEGVLSFRESISGYFALWRYDSKLVLGLFSLMYLGWVALAGGLESLEPVVVARVALGWVAATAILLAIFLVNDAADREIDRVVHPERPIPQGKAAWQHVYLFGVVLLGFGVLLSLAVNRNSALIAVAMAALALGHYGYAKTKLQVPCSSEIITPIVSAFFPAYALAVGELEDFRVGAYVLAFIYFADLGQDLLGGIHDQEGDRRHGVRTFALAIGNRSTLVVSLVCFVVAMGAGLLVYQRGPAGMLYLVIFGGLTLYMLYRYILLFRARGDALLEEAGSVNHVAGGYFFLVSAALLPDFVLRILLQ